MEVSADTYNVYPYSKMSPIYSFCPHISEIQKSNTSNEACKLELYDSKPVVLRQLNMCSVYKQVQQQLHVCMCIYLGQLRYFAPFIFVQFNL